VECGSSVGLGYGMARGVGILVVSGSGAGLGPGMAQGAESLAGLWGGDLAGQLFFY
jgi:hypothetical protein